MKNCRYKVISLCGETEEIIETNFIECAIERALFNNTEYGMPVQVIDTEDDEVLLVGGYTVEGSWISRKIAPYIIRRTLLN